HPEAGALGDEFGEQADQVDAHGWAQGSRLRQGAKSEITQVSDPAVCLDDCHPERSEGSGLPATWDKIPRCARDDILMATSTRASPEIRVPVDRDAAGVEVDGDNVIGQQEGSHPSALAARA